MVLKVQAARVRKKIKRKQNYLKIHDALLRFYMNPLFKEADSTINQQLKPLLMGLYDELVMIAKEDVKEEKYLHAYMDWRAWVRGIIRLRDGNGMQRDKVAYGA